MFTSWISRSGGALIVAAVGALSASSLAQVPAVGVSRETVQVVGQPIKGIDYSKLGLIKGDLFALDVDTTPGKPMDVVIPIPGERPLSIKLNPYSIRGENFKLYETRTGVLTEVDPGPINTLRGSVNKHQGSIVAGGVMDDGLYLRIELADGRSFWVEPAAKRLGNVAQNMHVLYTPQDVIQNGSACGATLAQHGIHDPGVNQPTTRGLVRYIADVAVECDWEYFALYGSVSQVNSRMFLVYNTLNVQYERDVDIQHQIVNVIVNNGNVGTTDPYAQATTGGMLDEMRNFWNGVRSGIGRDIAHLFTGKPTGGVIGTAYVGVVCSSLTTGFGYGVSQTDFNSFNLASAADLVAHETGHNWNSCHCACGSPAFTMNPSITSINRFGTVADECATSSIGAIVAHRNSRTCLAVTGVATDPPHNDACGGAAAIGPGTWGFGNVGATTEGPAPCVTAGADIWYYFVATHDATATVSTCGSHDSTSFDSVLTAYSGSCGALTELACNDDANVGNPCGGLDTGTIRDSYIQFSMTRGSLYYIRLSGYASGTGTGLINFFQSSCINPPNDNCGSATTVADGSYPYSTICSTTDGTVDTGCDFFGNRQVGSDIWYNYTAQCSGTVTVSTCGSTHDSKIAIYANNIGCNITSPGNANLALACNDDACGFQSSVSFAAIGGTTYKIRVGGYYGAQGTGVLTISNATCPLQANDFCANATIIPSVGGVFTGHLAAATSDSSLPICGSAAAGKNVWYSFTPCSNGTAVFNTCGTHDGPGIDLGMDTVVAVFDGCGGNFLACNDDNFNQCGTLDTSTLRDSYVSMPVVAGSTYLVRVSPWSSSVAGAFTLRATFTPANDGCAFPTPPQAFTGATPFCNFGATDYGISETCLGGIAITPDVWFYHTAVNSGTITVTTCDPATNFDTVLAIYDGGCPIFNNTTIACNDDDFSCSYYIRVSTLTFTGVAGQNYFIRIGGYFGNVGSGVLHITDAPAPTCPANIDDGSGTGTPDAGVDISDLIYFLTCFADGNLCADLDDDGADPQLPNGGVDVNDLIFFLTHFEAGC
jgi:Metallo-peptidase family M12